MSILGKKALFEPLRTINSATLTASYQTLGSILANSSVLLKIVNNGTTLVTISYDGINDHDVIPANGFVLYDFGSDAQSNSGDARLSFSQGSQIWVKGTAGTGSIYAITVYVGN